MEQCSYIWRRLEDSLRFISVAPIVRHVDNYLGYLWTQMIPNITLVVRDHPKDIAPGLMASAYLTLNGYYTWILDNARVMDPLPSWSSD